MTESIVSQYLDSLMVTSVIRNRITEIEKFYAKLLPGKSPSYFFISETVDTEGNRIFDTASFFYKGLWCEAHNFQYEDNFDLAPVKDVNHLILQLNDYEVGLATAKSRLTITFRFATNSNFGSLKASGANCESLWRIVQEFVLPLTLTVE